MKKIFVVMMMFIVLFSFIACDNSSPTSEPSSTTEETTSETYDYDVYIDYSADFSDVYVDRWVYDEDGNLLDSITDFYSSDGEYHYTWDSCEYDYIEIEYYIDAYTSSSDTESDVFQDTVTLTSSNKSKQFYINQ